MKLAKGNTFRAFYPLLVICLTAIIICICGIIRELNINRQGRNYYSALSNEAEDLNNAEEKQAEVESTPTDTILNMNENQSSMSQEQNSPIPEQLFFIDFNTLRKAIPDIVAWIRCHGTIIDYPIVKGTDNIYYLKHLPDGTSNRMGSIFLDYNNSSDFSDRNSVIYGHHMRSGDMFSILENYREQSFYDEHPVIELYTPDHNFILELFAGYVADAEYETIPLTFQNSDEYMQYIDKIQECSTFQSNVILEKEDKLVSLCTCTYTSSDARYVIVAKLTEIISQTE